MSTLEELVPGDRVKLGGREAVFIGLGLCPGSSVLRTVVWKLDTHEWSVDKLRFNQEIGIIVRDSPAERHARLLAALKSGGATV